MELGTNFTYKAVQLSCTVKDDDEAFKHYCVSVTNNIFKNMPNKRQHKQITEMLKNVVNNDVSPELECPPFLCTCDITDELT